jgi:ribonuclease-3
MSVSMNDIREKADTLGLAFQNLALLEEALTHRSYLNEHKSAKAHNERLEFLGDAVLELATTRFLYDRFPEKPEGELTAYRAALVNTVSLAQVAERIQLSNLLYLSKGESKDTGRARLIILANAFEALLGALYLDQGYDAAVAYLEVQLFPTLDGILESRAWQDAKSRFQEAAQDKRGITPSYKTLAEEGPDHARVFTVGVYLGEAEIAQGSGKSKQEAEQEAAKNALGVHDW